MPTIRIRPATPADVPLVLALVKELADYEKSAAKVVATESLLLEDLFGPRPVCEAIVGEVDGVAQGFALFFHNFSTWVGRRGVYLEDLYVRPHARGAGLGRALLSRVAAIAVERGCTRCDWMVLNWNEPAIRFYQSLGAEPMSEWTTFRLQGAALAKLGAASGTK